MSSIWKLVVNHWAKRILNRFPQGRLPLALASNDTQTKAFVAWRISMVLGMPARALFYNGLGAIPVAR